jgi:2-dehydro-3-deoxyphosphooctonate aldolase (KDO 8-P synthase)
MIQYLDNIQHKDSKNFFLIAGPCIIEGEDMALRIAEKVINITDKYNIPYIFKGSFKKANRSRVDSFTTIGEEKSLEILKKVGETFNIPTTTDIHENEHAALAAQYVDVLADSCIFGTSDRPFGCCSKNRKMCDFEKRTVPFSGSYEVCSSESYRF